jgi:hypothetical protein
MGTGILLWLVFKKDQSAALNLINGVQKNRKRLRAWAGHPNSKAED